MILYDLKCRKGHLFEAWFRDSNAYETQVEAAGVSCPVCGSTKVAKAPMAPHVARPAGKQPANPQVERAGQVRAALGELRRQIEANCDYVGATFAEEARKIHYGEVAARNIYGETSDQEAKSLAEEGVEVQRVPWLPRENS